MYVNVIKVEIKGNTWIQDIVVEPENIYSIGNQMSNIIKVIIKVLI